MVERYFTKDANNRGGGIRCLDQDVQVMATHNFGGPEISGHIAVVSIHEKILIFSGVRNSIFDKDGVELMHPTKNRRWGYIWHDVHFLKRSGPVYDRSYTEQAFVSSNWESEEDLRLTIKIVVEYFTAYGSANPKLAPTRYIKFSSRSAFPHPLIPTDQVEVNTHVS